MLDDETRVSLAVGTRGWIRRLAPPHWRRGAPSGSRDSVVRSSWMALLVGAAAEPTVEWLTPYANLITAENKLLQVRCASRLGIPTPKTVVVRDVTDIPPAIGASMVVKPLGPGHYVTYDGEAVVIWAHLLDRTDPRLAQMAGAPFLVQEYVPPVRHLRVVTVGERSWACALEATNLPLDWRSDETAHHSFSTASDVAVQHAAVRLAHTLRLGYSSQDWIDTGDRIVFVDLNPAGQWLFLPEPTSDEVAHAIAAFLIGGVAGQ